MKTQALMTACALVLGLTGIALTFLPNEIALSLSLAGKLVFPVIVLQLLGALYFAFAMMNWTAKSNLIGGIYGRPIAIGNLTHFIIGALALLKAFFSVYHPVLLVGVIVYVAFAILFSIVFLTHPIQT